MGLTGLYLAVSELKQSPLHHNTIIWVLGFGIAGAAAVGLYKEVRNRLTLRSWLTMQDRAELLEKLPEVRKAVADLPPWHRTRYLRKKGHIDELPVARPPAGEPRPGAVQKRLLTRLRKSALFVLSVVVLGIMGAFSFVQWLQIVVSDFGNPAPWLVAWASAAVYFFIVGVAVLVDELRRRYRRRDATAQTS